MAVSTFTLSLATKADSCLISITNPPNATLSVPEEVTQFTLQGTSSLTNGNLSWLNQNNAASGLTPTTSTWSVLVPLAFGTNRLVVTGSTQDSSGTTTNASDSGSHFAYASAWANGSNGGTGFGNWTLFTTAISSGNGGFFMAQNQTNLNIGPRAWGLYANSGNTSWAQRAFSAPLQTGQTFRFSIDSHVIDVGGSVAAHLANSNGEPLWSISYQGGANFYMFSDQVTELPYTTEGLEVAFTLTSPTNYSLTIVRAGTTTHTFIGVLLANTNTIIDRVRFHNNNAGPDGARNIYVNHLAILTGGNVSESCSATVSVFRAGTPPVEVTGSLTADQPYVEVDGFVGGEAEFYHARSPGGGVAWTFIAKEAPGAFANARGIGFMRALPDSGTITAYQTGPALEYIVHITNPGDYQLWLRWDGADDSSDSIFAGIPELADGAGGQPDWYELFGNVDANFNSTPWDVLGGFEANEPAPIRGNMTFTFPAPGIYTLRIVPREDGVALDSWILQRPPPYRIDPPDTNPIIAVPDSITMHHQAKAGIPVLRNDSGNITPSTAVVVTPPTYGTATPLADGRMLYTHLSGYPAEDSFTYRVGGPGGSNSSPATVVITFSTDLRIPNTTVAMPVEPPPTSYSVADLFPTLSNFAAPTSMESPPGDTNRIFVTQRNGMVYVITNINASPGRQVFLDISSRVQNDGNELGLKGIAFHPGYATNRTFYLTYCHVSNGVRYVRLSAFQAFLNSPNLADASSESILIHQRNDNTVHNIDDAVFGPDGYLYVGFGDEGPQNDGANNSQRIDKDIWSAIIRIDPDFRPGNLPHNPHESIPTNRFLIPSDNPFIGATQFNGIAVASTNVRTEFFAVGFRNPWQFAFDPLTDEMWVADVGNELWEEVSIIPRGGNGGWVFFEGNAPGPRGDRTPPPGFVWDRPVWVYGHGMGEFQGFSITGGLIYRGTKYGDLYGKYLCSDYVSGNIWTIERTASATNVVRITGEGGLVQFDLHPANGDIIMLDHGDGRIRRLATQSAESSFPEKLSETGFFADLADLSPNPGVIAYTPNLSFWSDYAIKSRWFVITNTTDLIGMSAEDNWSYPNGMMWVKHFDLEMQRGNPATKKRIETRVLVKNSGGSYGVSYQWDAAGAEATLIGDAGVNFNLNITNNESVIVQDWRIPSRAECIICHNPPAGHALSFKTRQLNCPGDIGPAHGNFIALLETAGYTSNSLGNPAQLARHVRPDEVEYSLEARARSYLAVNCGYCHMGADSVVPGNWDGRAFVKLFDTGMIYGQAGSNGGDTNNLLIVPNDVPHSIIWNRIAVTNGFTRMPPLGSSELDQVNIQMLAQWIGGELATRQSFAQWQIDNFGSTNHPNAAADADPDVDGRSNHEEFLTYTNPHDELDFWSADFIPHGSTYALTHDLANRNVFVETSTNLETWAFWNVPENNGIPIIPGSTWIMPLATNLPPDFRQFFRFYLNEP